ncbi:hypothetical protein ACP70R_003497 [Stipagrostis hirtigluma subsp. patula]
MLLLTIVVMMVCPTFEKESLPGRRVPRRKKPQIPIEQREKSLVADLDVQRASGGVVLAAESLRSALFGVMAAMCFGEDVDDGIVRAMDRAMDDLVQCFLGLRVFVTLPAITGLIFRNRWRKLVELRRQQEEMYLPLIDARRVRPSGDGEPPAYVTRSWTSASRTSSQPQPQPAAAGASDDGDLVGLCSEFLGAGTEPAASALQWIMANLVKRPDVGEEVLGRLEYLNAVIMEGLRLHPPAPLVLRQTTSTSTAGVFPAGPAATAVHFPLAKLARDKKAWTYPHEFRPERVLASGDGEGLSLVAAAESAGEIRMMSFGAGRRMCPGMGIAMLHLGYFVANLVTEFEWAEADGHHAVDLQPHVGFFFVMKRPLRARLTRCRVI